MRPVVRRLAGSGRATGRRLATVLVGALLGVLLIPVLASPAWSCTCVRVTDRQALASADVAFTGTVEDKRTSSVTVAVAEVYKGSPPQRVELTTGSASTACGAELRRHRQYLVFASFDVVGARSGGAIEGHSAVAAAEDRLGTHLCSGTRKLAAGEELDLVVASEPLPGTDEIAADGFPLLGWLSLAAVVVLGLLPVGLWLRYSRTSRTT